MKSCSLFGLFWLASFTMVVSFAFTFQGSSTLGHVLLFHSFLLLNDILSYDYTIFCPFIHQLIDIWVISTFWLILILLLWIFVYRFWSRYVFISLAYIPSSGFAGSYGNSVFNHLKKLQTGFFFFSFTVFRLPWWLRRLPTMPQTQVQSLGWKISWRRKWKPTPVFLPVKSHGWRSLVAYSPWGCKESDTTEWLHSLTEAVLQRDWLILQF